MLHNQIVQHLYNKLARNPIVKPFLNDWSGLIYSRRSAVADGFSLGSVSGCHTERELEHPFSGILKGLAP